MEPSLLFYTGYCIRVLAMKVPVFLALCAFGLVSSRIPSPSWLEEVMPESRSLQESVFRSGREFRFVYNGQLLTGIPSSSQQHSGTRIQALVSLVFRSQTSVVMKFTHARMGKINRPLPNPSKILPFPAFEETPISKKLQKQLEAPVQFSYDGGLISDVVFEDFEQPWSANFKRSVLNLLQVNMQKRNPVNAPEESLSRNELRSEANSQNENEDFFRVMEKTLEGECETMYTFVSEPNLRYSSGPVLNITKSINFENCLKRPEIKYNYRFSEPCPEMENEEKFLRTSSVFNFQVSGTPESFLIERSNIDSQYVIVPFNEEGNVIVTYVNQTLVLFQSGPIETSIPEISNPVQSDSQMVYSPDWDILKEQFFMEGEEEFHQKTPFSSIKNKVEFAASLLRKFVSNMRESVEDEAPRNFDFLVSFFRILKRQEIERVWKAFFVETPEQFTPEEHKKIKSVLVDSMALAGTKDNVAFLVQKIKSRQLSPFMAALAIKSFVNIRVVSQEMIQELFTLAEDEVTQRNFFLKQSVYLTVGSMINALCSSSEDFLASEIKLENPQQHFCPRQLKEKYVQTLVNKFQSAQNWEQKVLFLKAINNAGLDVSVFELEKIIQNSEQQYPSFIRFEAILALKKIRVFMPRKVQRILMPIFMNRFETPELRIAAAYQIFQSMPERPILDQIARRLSTESNRQVQSFVFTYMHTTANSSIPCEQQFAEDLKLALRHSSVPSFAFLMGYSKMIHQTLFTEKMNFGLGSELGVVFSNSSYFPRMLSANINPFFGGFWAKKFFSFRFNAEGLDNIFWKYFGERGFFFEKPIEEFLQRSPRSIKTQSPMNHLKSMFESLRIRPREFFPNRPRASFSLGFRGDEFAYLPFNFDSLPEDILRMVESGRFDLRSIEQILQNGYHFQFYKSFLLHEMSYKIPTSLGFPLQFRASVPTVSKLTGEVKVEFNPNQPMDMIKVVFNELKPSFVSAWVSNVQVWNPVVNSGLKVIVKAKFFYPFTGSMQLNLRKSPKEFVFNIQPAARPVNVLTLETRPVTYTFNWPQSLSTFQEAEEITVMGEEFNHIKKFDYNFGENVFGVKFQLRGRWHQTPVMRNANTPFCPLSGPNKLVFSTQPGKQMPKQYKLRLTGQFFQPLNEQLRPQFREFQQIEESFEPLNMEVMRSFVPSAPTQHQIKIQIESTDSSSPRKFQFETFAKCGEQMRFCQLSTKFERSAMSSVNVRPFQFCFDAETLFPQSPFQFRDLAGKKAIAQFKANWGQDCQSSQKFARLNVVAQRSQDQVQFERQSPEYQLLNEESSDLTLNSPVFQYQHVNKFAELLEYKYELQYNEVPEFVQEYTNYFFRFLKQYFFYQTEVDQINVRNPDQKVRGILSLHPWNRGYFNFTVNTPSESTIFRDIPIRPAFSLAPVNIRSNQPMFSMLRSMTPFANRPMCSVNSRFIDTFDSVRYTVPLTTCYAALVKDCRSAEQPTFGVFLKKVNQESQLKKVKIVTPYHIFYLAPQSESYDSVKIEFNGQQFSPEEFQPIIHHEHIVARVEKIGQYVKFELPEAGVSVYFDGVSVNVKLSPFYQNTQCGLCGHFNNEPSDEFRLPSNQLTDDVREFYRSYIVSDESCTIPELDEICSSERCDTPQESVLLCPTCQHLVREARRLESFTKKSFQELLERNWLTIESQSEQLESFLEPRINQLVRLLQSPQSEFKICQEIRACFNHQQSQEEEDDDDQESSSSQSSEEFENKWNSFPRSQIRSVDSQFPIFRTKVLEQNHQFCFSKEPIPVCPHHSFARSFKPERRVVFTCLSRDDPQAEIFFQRAVRNLKVIEEVAELPASFTELELFPEACSPMY